METSPTALTRRALLGSAAALTAVPLGVGTAEAGPRHAPHHHPGGWRPGPETVDLPAGLRPEGITSGPGSRFYVGSLADGRIVTGDLFGTGSDVLLPGAAGRQLRGLFWDPRSRLIWAAGNVGDVARVWAVHSGSGEVIADIEVPGGRFLNDLVATRSAVWVTDSRVDRLTRIGLRRSGRPATTEPAFLPLGGEWPAGDGVANNANGIRTLPDGSLVLNNSRVGGLWQVDQSDGSTRAIPVLGGPGLVGGDGLERVGRVLFDVRGSGQQEVSVLFLEPVHTDDHSSGHGSWYWSWPWSWSARWIRALTDPTLDVPSTATWACGSLWAVNARFGVADPAAAPYWITRLP